MKIMSSSRTLVACATSSGLSLLIGIVALTAVVSATESSDSSIAAGGAAVGGGGLRNAAAARRNLRQLQNRCGDCQDCTDEVWNKIVSDYNGDFSCGARIDWVTANGVNPNDGVTIGMPQYDACMVVAANEFPTECGKACNPKRCDGRQDPYVVPDDPTPVQAGDLTADTDLYCFPPLAARQEYPNVWSNAFVMQVKESPSPTATCDPGNTHFSNQAVAFDAATQELTLEFKKQSGRWMGGEVRLVLPPGEAPFSYGTYRWSLKSVKILNANTGVMVDPPRPLPPRLTIGLFTWDATENFDIRENRNHEVDIEIGNFGNAGGPDVHFLVQPPGQPQHAKLYSGGAAGSYDQSGYAWEFTWSPNQIAWSSTAAGGSLSHLYSADIIQDYYSPPWLQCMPADVEIRVRTLRKNGVGLDWCRVGAF